MEPPVVAHIVPWTNIAGTELATLRLAEAAREGGYAGLIYLPDQEGAEQVEALARARGFPSARYRQVPLRRSRPLPYLRNALRLADDFRRRKIGLVHCADIMGGYFTALAGHLAGARVISHVRASHGRLNSLDRLLLKPVEHYVFVSESARRDLDLTLPPQRCTVLYDAAPPVPARQDRAAARAHYGLAADTIVFGMPARISPQKDHATLIRAIAQVQAVRDDVHVLLAGDTGQDPAHSAALSALVAQTGTGAHVHFAGFEGDMARFYAAIDVMVLAAHQEGFPLVLLEAMGGGLPVIATRVSGIPEAVIDGETGLLVPHAEAQALALAMLRLAGDPALRAAMGEAGRRRAQTVFSPARFRRELGALYAGLVEVPPAG